MINNKVVKGRNMKKTTATIISVLILGVLATLAAGSLDTDSDTSDIQSQQPAYTMSAGSLYYAYKANEVSADNKYKGKIVELSGRIINIGKDITDSPYITIYTDGFMGNVNCYFTEGEAKTFNNLNKGQSITVKGQVDGMSIGAVVISKSRIQ